MPVLLPSAVSTVESVSAVASTYSLSSSEIAARIFSASGSMPSCKVRFARIAIFTCVFLPAPLPAPLPAASAFAASVAFASSAFAAFTALAISFSSSKLYLLAAVELIPSSAMSNSFAPDSASRCTSFKFSSVVIISVI